MVPACQSLLSAINRCKSMMELKQLHAQVICAGLSDDDFLASKLLLFSAVTEAGDLEYTHKLFHSVPRPNTFVWNTIIRGCSGGKNPNQAVSHFVRMLRSGVDADYLTFPFLGKACARILSVPLGQSIHCCIDKLGLCLDRFVQNSLVHMYASCGDITSARKMFDGVASPNLVSWNAMLDGYAKCGDMVSARGVFEKMPEKDIVSWSALIDGYVKSQDYDEAVSLFESMQEQGTRANTVTMISVLSACAHLGELDRGRAMHRYVECNGLQTTLVLATSLIDMYSKCGSVYEALRVFSDVRKRYKTDVLIWNAMIAGLAMHGLGKDSMQLFDEMQAVGIKPDEITYLSLLSACAHGGRVEDAWTIFKSLETHGMKPHTEHYACMVDALGRSGHVEQAFEFVRNMPVEPSASVLGALLSACQTHGRMELGEEVAKKLIKLEPYEDGRYIGLSNVYASARRWGDARTARRVMEERGVKKIPGCSSVEVSGKSYGFTAHDRVHPQSAEMYCMLNVIVDEMKMESGCVIFNGHLYESVDP